MKSIGFIDYFLNEWHADNYPAWINAQTNGEMQVKYAYGHIQPGDGLMTNEQWAEKNGVELCATIDEVIEKSDYIVVLSPDNPEMHVELSKKALESGKPVSALTLDELCAAAKFGNAAGSVCATKKGAIPALPDVKAIEDCMANVPLLVL